MPKRSPAFQFYPADFLSDANQAAMSPKEAGAYIRLLCHCWLEGSLPADVDRLAALCGLDRRTAGAVLKRVLECFRLDQTVNRYVHGRLDEEFEKQKRLREIRAKAGAMGGRPAKPKGSATKAKPKANSQANESLSSSSSSSDLPDQSKEHSDRVVVPTGDLQLEADTDRTSPDDGLGVQGLIALWNEHRKPGPHVMKAAAKVWGDAKRALKLYPNRADWIAVIQFLNAEAWANAPGKGDHGSWRAGLEWLVKPGKMGQYLERARLQGQGGPVGRDARTGQPGTERGKYADISEG